MALLFLLPLDGFGSITVEMEQEGCCQASRYYTMLAHGLQEGWGETFAKEIGGRL